MHYGLEAAACFFGKVNGFNLDVVIGGMGMLVQNPHFAHVGEETVKRFDYVPCFHGFSGNKFQNGSYRVTFLGVDNNFLTVAGVA